MARVELFRASLAAVVLCVFFSCSGGAGVECYTGDLVVAPDGRIHLYHQQRKAQRGAPMQTLNASQQPMCQLPAATHPDIALVMRYFHYDVARQSFAGGRMSVAWLAIGHNEGHEKSTVDTIVTSWLYLAVLSAVHDLATLRVLLGHRTPSAKGLQPPPTKLA